MIVSVSMIFGFLLYIMLNMDGIFLFLKTTLSIDYVLVYIFHNSIRTMSDLNIFCIKFESSVIIHQLYVYLILNFIVPWTQMDT